MPLRSRFLISGLLLGFLGSFAATAGISELEVGTRDGARRFLLAVPDGPRMGGRPLVLVLHGHMGSAKNALGSGLQARSPLSAWKDLVDREGIVVAALDGARGEDGKQGWNDGRPGDAGNPRTDDLGFVSDVIRKVEREQGTDPGRVCVMGMSNGGVFALRLALDLEHPLAAVAAACASMPGDRAPAPSHRPVPVLLIAGTEDPLMPYAGGQVHFREQRRGAVLGVEATLAFWRASDCLGEASATEEALPHLKPADPTRAFRKTWGAPGGPQVALLRIEGGGHCEPSLAHRYGLIYTSVCGRQNGDVESAEEAWRFFKGRRAR
jgi:polyhydroxybutyrate depolymerase